MSPYHVQVILVLISGRSRLRTTAHVNSPTRKNVVEAEREEHTVRGVSDV